MMETAFSPTKADGEKAGANWRDCFSEPEQISRLSEARDPIHDWHFGEGESAYSAAEQFYFLIEPDDKGRREAAAEFWQGIADDWQATCTTDFVQGFAEAVADH